MQGRYYAVSSAMIALFAGIYMAHRLHRLHNGGEVVGRIYYAIGISKADWTIQKQTYPVYKCPDVFSVMSKLAARLSYLFAIKQMCGKCSGLALYMVSIMTTVRGL